MSRLFTKQALDGLIQIAHEQKRTYLDLSDITVETIFRRNIMYSRDWITDNNNDDKLTEIPQGVNDIFAETDLIFQCLESSIVDHFER